MPCAGCGRAWSTIEHHQISNFFIYINATINFFNPGGYPCLTFELINKIEGELCTSKPSLADERLWGLRFELVVAYSYKDLYDY